VEFVGRARFERGNEVAGEAACVLGLTVHEQSTTADVVADRGRTLDHIAQQRRPQAVSFVLEVDAESCQQGDGLGVATRALAEPSAHDATRCDPVAKKSAW